ncbi:MAG: hypothetical protein IKB02_03235 [Clostridia bacterium]|nr:hypothetical protein [Clostridia bacterium]
MQENINSVQSTPEECGTSVPPQNKKDPEKLFPLRYSKYNSFYLLVVLAAVISIGVGIFVAVTGDLMWGVVIFFAGIFIYAYFASSELHEKLGIWHRTDAGALLVTKCRARYGDVFYIPSRLLWYDVEEICDRAFFSPANKNGELVAVFLPKSLKKIGEDVFASCESLHTLYFEGSEEEFSKIESKTSFEGMEIIFNSSLPQKKK